MKFHRTTPNNNYRSLRLCSENGRWEIGLNPYTHGMRLRMGRKGHLPQVMDFCLGTNPDLFAKVLIAVLGRLDSLDENASPDEVDAAFPWAGTRPDMAVHLTDLLACSPALEGVFRA